MRDSRKLGLDTAFLPLCDARAGGVRPRVGVVVTAPGLPPGGVASVCAGWGWWGRGVVVGGVMVGGGVVVVVGWDGGW